ncbi:MAG: AMP-binding protein, partial [Methylococcaceae bacterium]|nr:AMP-binding protein [Methylococcaceae bacterium]
YSESGIHCQTVEASYQDILDQPELWQSLVHALQAPSPTLAFEDTHRAEVVGKLDLQQTDESQGFKTLIDVVDHWAQAQPEARAYTFLNSRGEEEKVLTYGELQSKALSLAGRLRQAGFEAGAGILMYPAGIDFIIAFIGCLYAGIAPAAVPLPKKKRSNARLIDILKASEAKLALMDGKTLSAFEEIRKHELSWPTDVAYLATDVEDAAEYPPIKASAIASDIAFLQFTSGSTSLPKGVVITHQNCLSNLRMIAAVEKPSPSSVFVSWLPHYHDLGLVSQILASLSGGSSCILLAPESFTAQPLSWLKAISRYRAHYTAAPNFAFGLCVNRVSEEDKKALDLSSLRVVINGAEPISAEVLADFSEYFSSTGFRSATFLPAYGMAEATVFIAAGNVESEPKLITVDLERLNRHRLAVPVGASGSAKTFVGCGWGRLGQDIKIVDSGHPLPPLQVGEIWVAGDNIMAGYYRHEEATAAAFGHLSGIESRYLKTGDLGFMDESGELFIAGRLKDLIIINGANYYPQDIEILLEQAHPDIRAGGTVAFGIPEGAGETLAAAVELNRQGTAAIGRDPAYLPELAQALCTAVGSNLEIQLTRLIVLKPKELPKTSSGKIQRRAFKQAFLEGNLNPLAVWPDPSSQTTSSEDVAMSNLENTLQIINEMGFLHLKVFSDLAKILNEKYRLRMVDLDLDKSLFYYGVDSISALDIHCTLEKSLGRPIPLSALFHADTLLGMIDEIASGLTHDKPVKANQAGLVKLNREIDDAVKLLSQRLEALPKSAAASQSGGILLTGATGYLGIHLLADLLKATDRTIHCLVRADDEASGFERILNNSKQNHVPLPFEAMPRIAIVTGDVAKPHFGLSESSYAELSQSIASIYHCAAIDNFHLPYEILKDINVTGTIEVGKLATVGRMKPVYYISSCSAALLDGADEALEKGGLVTGYAQSKYVAEKIILGLIDKGVPWVNYRLGLLYSLHLDEIEPGASFEQLLSQVKAVFRQYGIPAPAKDVFAYGDNFGNFLKIIPKLGCMPDMDADIDLLPVEYASRAIIDTSLAETGARKPHYTFYNPESLKWRDVAEYYQRQCQIRPVALQDFLDEFNRWARQSDNKPIKLMSPILSDQLAEQINRMYRDANPDNVKKFGEFCPPCDKQFAHQYVNYILNGFAA